MDRVIAYIDGFNLYFGLKAKKWERYLWLNIKQLVKNLLKSNQELILTKYFTSRVSSNPEKQKRQSLFLEALETIPDLQIFYGQYKNNERTCRKCGYKDYVPQEKMTDVNIAVEMMTDAFQNSFDTAILISGDSDLTAPINSIKKIFPDKYILVAFPPERFNFQLASVANGYYTINRNKIAQSLFPKKILKSDGYVLECPESWT
jgi:uncharacterized LabA/DUF88 family protein